MSTSNSDVYNTITPGDFSQITCHSSRRYLIDAYKAVSKTEGGWDFLKNNHPSVDKGFMFWHNNVINQIVSNMETKSEHSGSSIAYVLHNMEYIATNGWESWCENFLPTKIGEGDFSFIENKIDRIFYEDVYYAITMTYGAWEFLKTESPPQDKDFMTWSHPILDNITSNMVQIGNHSGVSFALNMRAMESIAKNGWTTWVTNYKAAQKKYA